MDNSADFSTHAWSTPVGAGVAGCIGGVVLLGGAIVVSNDPAGSVLMGIAGVLLVALGVYTLLVRPRLELSAQHPATLTVRSLTGRRSYTPDRVERIRLLSMRRVGRRVGQLEIDVLDDDAETGRPDGSDGPRDDTRLLVFSRWDLGTDLMSVVDALRAAGFHVDDDR
ncbi:PH domain-containing protein [Gordonia rubripertincta]|uniref:PH domain-containing protein n=1 Tax=Gordonia rubripertincta TaxID=36822 RepID=UPI00117DE383|nr:PH domain-containing protein [Gordonia rubripertincta]TSD95895.1 PH domain-containing protein [Gordonia rubripertincta]